MHLTPKIKKKIITLSKAFWRKKIFDLVKFSIFYALSKSGFVWSGESKLVMSNQERCSVSSLYSLLYLGILSLMRLSATKVL